MSVCANQLPPSSPFKFWKLQNNTDHHETLHHNTHSASHHSDVCGQWSSKKDRWLTIWRTSQPSVRRDECRMQVTFTPDISKRSTPETDHLGFAADPVLGWKIWGCILVWTSTKPRLSLPDWIWSLMTWSSLIIQLRSCDPFLENSISLDYQRWLEHGLWITSLHLNSAFYSINCLHAQEASYH